MPSSGQKYLSKKSFFLFLYLFDLKLTELSDIYVKLLLKLKIVLFVGFPCSVKSKVNGLCSKWTVQGVEPGCPREWVTENRLKKPKGSKNFIQNIHGDKTCMGIKVDCSSRSLIQPTQGTMHSGSEFN